MSEPSMPLVVQTPAGLYCPQAGVHIDPRGPVAMAIVTHAHADHFWTGCQQYITARPGVALLRHRLSPLAKIEGLAYGETRSIRGVTFSLHPAGHILGSAQVRIQYRGEVWVVSGDYKTTPDPTCAAFEPVRCHTFITESTFGRPEFRWPAPETVWEEVRAWRAMNQRLGWLSLIQAYALGKSQRVLAGIDADAGLVFCSPQVHALNEIYRAEGISLPKTAPWESGPSRNNWGRSLLLVAPRTPWSTQHPKYGNFSTALASGWMTDRAEWARRRVDQGFALSDHADYAEILQAVKETGAERVYAMHGSVDELVVSLTQLGYQAEPVPKFAATVAPYPR